MSSLKALVVKYFRAGNCTTVGQLGALLRESGHEYPLPAIRRVVHVLEHTRVLQREISPIDQLARWRWNPQEPRYFHETQGGLVWRVRRRKDGKVIGEDLTEAEACACVEALNALEVRIDRGVTRPRTS